jgi:hypothetical protein
LTPHHPLPVLVHSENGVPLTNLSTKNEPTTRKMGQSNSLVQYGG